MRRWFTLSECPHDAKESLRFAHLPDNYYRGWGFELVSLRSCEGPESWVTIHPECIVNPQCKTNLLYLVNISYYRRSKQHLEANIYCLRCRPLEDVANISSLQVSLTIIGAGLSLWRPQLNWAYSQIPYLHSGVPSVKSCLKSDLL